MEVRDHLETFLSLHHFPKTEGNPGAFSFPLHLAPLEQEGLPAAGIGVVPITACFRVPGFAIGYFRKFF